MASTLLWAALGAFLAFLLDANAFAVLLAAVVAGLAHRWYETQRAVYALQQQLSRLTQRINLLHGDEHDVSATKRPLDHSSINTAAAAGLSPEAMPDKYGKQAVALATTSFTPMDVVLQTKYQGDEKQASDADVNLHHFDMSIEHNSTHNIWQQCYQRGKDWLLTGNPLVKIGMLVLFIGLSFLAKHVASSQLLPFAARFVLLGMVGVALVITGWRTRHRQRYGLVLQGGGLAVMYLTLYTAASFYPVLNLSIAFALMLLVVIAATVLAVMQNAQILAMMASAGGFLVPLLTSDGGNNYVGLFSYYFLLNTGLLAIAWFKSWRQLNFTGFIFTFIITLSWCLLAYKPEFYMNVQIFIMLFFLQYCSMMLLFSMRQPPQLKGFIDSSLMFGLPLVVYGQQVTITSHIVHGDSISALVLALFYAGVSFALSRTLTTSHQLFRYCLNVLSVSFATVVLFTLLDSQWASVSFALEATALVWLGFKQQRAFSRWCGLALYVMAVILLLMDDVSAGTIAFIQGDFLHLVLLAASACVISYLYDRFAELSSDSERIMPKLLFYTGMLWFLLSFLMEFRAHRPDHFIMPLVLAMTSIVFCLQFLGRQLQWLRPRLLNYAVLPFAAFCWLFDFWQQAAWRWQNPFSDVGIFTIAAVLGMHYRWLYQRYLYHCSSRDFRDADPSLSADVVLSNTAQGHTGYSTPLQQRAAANDKHAVGPMPLIPNDRIWHGAATYAISGLWLWFGLYLCQAWQAQPPVDAWIMLIALLIPWLLILLFARTSRWPVATLPRLYQLQLPKPWLLGLLVIIFYSMQLPQHPMQHLVFIPMLNPIDGVMLLATTMIGAYIMQYRRFQKAHHADERSGTRHIDLAALKANRSYQLFAAFMLLCFMLLNAILLRSLHVYLDIPYQLTDLLAASSVQLALSICWALLAMSAMLLASRWLQRWLWLLGFGLMAVVVAKLFFIDIAELSTISRIIAFVSVGAIMLLLGYLTPIPPKPALPQQHQ
jgi:uncharacterized membrane protein